MVPRAVLDKFADMAATELSSSGAGTIHAIAKAAHRTFRGTATAAAAATDSTSSTLAASSSAAVDDNGVAAARSRAAAACAGYIRMKWSALSLRVVRPYNISKWFDDSDITLLRPSFLGLVLDYIIEQTNADIAHFAAEWPVKHQARFAAVVIGENESSGESGDGLMTEEIFSITDGKRYIVEFLAQGTYRTAAVKGEEKVGGK